MSNRHSRASAFDNAPWRAMRPITLGHAGRVPTMLSWTERQLYFWLTARGMAGVGDVVDLGCYVGGSTALLAAGHASAGRRSYVHAYDKFETSEALKRRLLYPSGVPQFGGSDILPLARALLGPWSDRIVFHPGRIEDLGWGGNPIDLLVVDAFKGTTATDRMTADFFPSLLPGYSIVVHQDFLRWSQPWLVSQMLRFGDAFRPVAVVPNDTAVFLCEKPIDAPRLRAAQVGQLSDAELLEDLGKARVWLAGFGVDDRLSDMARAVRRNPGVRVGWKMAQCTGTNLQTDPVIATL